MFEVDENDMVDCRLRSNDDAIIATAGQSLLCYHNELNPSRISHPLRFVFLVAGKHNETKKRARVKTMTTLKAKKNDE